MAKINVVTPTNLGKGIKKNVQTKKFDVAIDNQTIQFNTEGELVANVGGGRVSATGGLVVNTDGVISINLGDIPTLQTGEHIVKERKAILLPEGRFIETEVSRIVRKALKNVPITVAFPTANYKSGWSVPWNDLVEGSVDGRDADNLREINKTLMSKAQELGTAKAFNEWSRGKTFTLRKSSFETNDSIYASQEKTFSLPQYFWEEYKTQPSWADDVDNNMEPGVPYPGELISTVNHYANSISGGDTITAGYWFRSERTNAYTASGEVILKYTDDPSHPIKIQMTKDDNAGLIFTYKSPREGKFTAEINMMFNTFHTKFPVNKVMSGEFKFTTYTLSEYRGISPSTIDSNGLSEENGVSNLVSVWKVVNGRETKLTDKRINLDGEARNGHISDSAPNEGSGTAGSVAYYKYQVKDFKIDEFVVPRERYDFHNRIFYSTREL